MSDFIIRTMVNGFLLGVEHLLFVLSYLFAICFVIGTLLLAVLAIYAAIYALVKLCEFTWRYHKLNKQRKEMEKDILHPDVTYTCDEQNHYTLKCFCGARAWLHANAAGRFAISCPKCGQNLTGKDPDDLRVAWADIQKAKQDYVADGKNRP